MKNLSLIVFLTIVLFTTQAQKNVNRLDSVLVSNGEKISYKEFDEREKLKYPKFFDPRNPWVEYIGRSLSVVHSINLDSFNLEIIKDINKYRSSFYLNKLVVDDSMTQYANSYARYLTYSNKFEHSNLNDHQYKAENLSILYGVSGSCFVITKEDINELKNNVLNGWKKSDGHNKNLLTESNYVGVGCYFYFEIINNTITYKYIFVYVVR